MAKAGSPEARAIAAGGARDLRALKITDEEAAAVRAEIELQLGARCRGCGRRITVGCLFTSIDPRDPEDRIVLQYASCLRGDCDFAMQCRGGATYMEPIAYEWVDDLGPEAPAAASVVARNERLMEARAAEERSGVTAEAASGG